MLLPDAARKRSRRLSLRVRYARAFAAACTHIAFASAEWAAMAVTEPEVTAVLGVVEVQVAAHRSKWASTAGARVAWLMLRDASLAFLLMLGAVAALGGVLGGLREGHRWPRFVLNGQQESAISVDSRRLRCFPQGQLGPPARLWWWIVVQCLDRVVEGEQAAVA